MLLNAQDFKDVPRSRVVVHKVEDAAAPFAQVIDGLASTLARKECPVAAFRFPFDNRPTGRHQEGLQMKLSRLSVLLGTGLLLACTAAAQTINFDDLAPGTTLGSQYAGLGVTFAANAFSGPGSSSSGVSWATNTDMTIVSIDTGVLGVDFGALGVPSLVSKNILQHFLNWETLEDGDPSFNILLANPAQAVSVTFAGVGGQAAAPDTRIFVYAGSTLLATRAGSLPDDNVGQLTLSYVGTGITRVAVAPGSFDDWVGVDNIVITPAAVVPEPEAWALTLLGLAAIAWSRRRLHS